MKNILFLSFLFFLSFLNLCIAKNFNKIDSDVEFFVAKKFFYEKKYDHANSIFNHITNKTNSKSKYFDESKIYKMIIKIKLKKFISGDMMNIKGIDHHYYDYIFYLYSISLLNTSFTDDVIINTLYPDFLDNDQDDIREALTSFQQIENKSNLLRSRSSYINALRVLEKSDLRKSYIEYKFRRCLTIINHTGKSEETDEIETENENENENNYYKYKDDNEDDNEDDFIIKYPEEFEKIYLKLKCYNELYLSFFTKKSLSEIEIFNGKEKDVVN